MYSFFIEAYHISHYITSNDRLLNNKSERIQKTYPRGLKVLFQQRRGRHEEEHEPLSSDSWPQYRDLSWNRSCMLITQLTHSVRTGGDATPSCHLPSRSGVQLSIRENLLLPANPPTGKRSKRKWYV